MTAKIESKYYIMLPFAAGSPCRDRRIEEHVGRIGDGRCGQNAEGDERVKPNGMGLSLLTRLSTPL
jgi:hypothetical protein